MMFVKNYLSLYPLFIHIIEHTSPVATGILLQQRTSTIYEKHTKESFLIHVLSHQPIHIVKHRFSLDSINNCIATVDNCSTKPG